MELRTLTSMIARRWFVVIPVLLVVMSIGYHESGRVTRTYETSTDELLLPPANSGPGTVATLNPFTSSGLVGAPRTTAVAIAAIMASDNVHAELANQGFGGRYKVTLLAGQVGLLQTVADSDSPESSLNLLRAVVSTIGAKLKTSQDAVQAPLTQRITPDVLTESAPVLVTTSNTRRILVATAAVGIAAVLGAAFAAESIARRAPETAREQAGRQTS